jgi:DNA-binding XRE family transcriptional regulator
MSKRGRRAKWDDDFVDIVCAAARQGYTEKQMSNMIGVSETTFNKWKREKPQFLQSLKESKLKADMKVADSIYKAANGYEYEEVHETSKNNDGKMLVERKVVTKNVPIDVGAAKMWLYNRDPDNWKSKTEVEHTGEKVIKILPAPDPKITHGGKL